MIGLGDDERGSRGHHLVQRAGSDGRAGVQWLTGHAVDWRPRAGGVRGHGRVGLVVRERLSPEVVRAIEPAVSVRVIFIPWRVRRSRVRGAGWP